MSDSRDLVRWQADSAKDKRIAELEAEIDRLKNPRVHDVTDLYEEAITVTNHKDSQTTSYIEWHCPECADKDKRIAYLEATLREIVGLTRRGLHGAKEE